MQVSNAEKRALLLATIVAFSVLEIRTRKTSIFLSRSCCFQPAWDKNQANNAPRFVNRSCGLQPSWEKKRANTAEKKRSNSSTVAAAFSLLVITSKQTMQKKKPHFVSCSFRCQSAGVKKQTSKAEKRSHFVSRSCRFQPAWDQANNAEKKPHCVNRSCGFQPSWEKKRDFVSRSRSQPFGDKKQASNATNQISC